MKSSHSLIGPYADLMNDIAFQWVFGQESNKDLLLLLLNEFITDRDIRDIALYKQHRLPYAKGLKKSVFDVSCVTDDGSLIDVEVQVRPQKWFADRCPYFSTFAVQGQVNEGSGNYSLQPVYVVSIDDFSRAHSAGWDGRVLSSYSLREDENHELMTDNLHFVSVELSSFKEVSKISGWNYSSNAYYHIYRANTVLSANRDYGSYRLWAVNHFSSGRFGEAFCI